ncbi:myb-binding protein 1A-like protein [Danio rerio]|uniref:Myb-binding protein 1A-like protein n=1 Tax=Danio rerio TaxID=7955 RepID=A0A0R4IH55_DANRE|nr:myb-binding protein 1A-like protein [Danio rerio]|eukprot:NP_001002042.2 myb-binding protein 1A-like protein [Danio rerio]
MVAVMQTDMGETENSAVRPKVTDAKGILKQNRQFLDYFWDIAKPERQIRLKAIEDLINYLKNSEQADELKYTLKRLVDGLSHTREDARSGYSVALAQLLSVFEEISLKSTLNSVKEKHNLLTASKKLIRNAVFGNFFGVLALSQSTRLHKEPQVMLECVQLLQSLSEYREHLRDLPRKTMVDILSETSQDVFEEVLFSALQSDLTSALKSPEQLELLLVALQKFPSVLKPKKLKKLLGTTAVITKQNMPRLVEVLKTAARSVKKENILPAVALDLLQVSLREDNFEMFWTDAIITGMMSEMPGPTHYLSFRLLGASLPLLSIPQLQFVLSGDVMRQYGEHTMSAQMPDRFKFAPEMAGYVGEFMQSCTDPDKQLVVVLGFTQLTNQGNPVVPSYWKALENMHPSAVQRYVDWLIEAFCKPQLENCLDFSTRRQKGNQEAAVESESCVSRFRKWIIPRLTFIVENQQTKKQEALVMKVVRFIFFHAFFEVKKPTSEIPETTQALSVPINQQTRTAVVSGFYSLLQVLNSMMVLGESVEVQGLNFRRIVGVQADGSMWIYSVFQFASMLLNQNKYVKSLQSFSPEQRQGWDSVLESVEALRKKAKTASSPEHTAFQQLFLLIGIQMFTSPEESLDLLKDLQTCMEKAQAKKSKKKKATDEPHWVEVIVEILLSLVSQPSRLVRSVCKTVFGRICPHLTQAALSSILNVLDPNKDEDESGVVVTDDKKRKLKEEDDDDEEEDDDNDEGDDDDDDDDEEGGEEGEESSDSSDDEEEDEAMEEGQEVDQNFRLELMKVLQGQNALATEEDGSDDEELDDAAMMKLDGSLASLFLEQRKKIQAKKDEKDRLNKEKGLVRDFKIKVLDMVEVFLSKQGFSPLVLGMVEPLLSVIENGMSSESSQPEQDYLRRVADIFRNRLCRGKFYCKEIDGREAELHEMLERLIGRAQKLTDSSVALYYFSAALYVLKVLRGSVVDQELSTMGKVEVERATTCLKNALTSFMTKRKSPLTGAMFIDLFNRFPVLCVNLMDTALENITAGLRDHQQGQACFIMLKALQCKHVKNLMTGEQTTELYKKVVDQLTKSLENVQCKNKTAHDKVVKALELCLHVVKIVLNQKMRVNLEPLQDVLASMNAEGCLEKTGKLEDTYWSVMRLFGVIKPKMEKVKMVPEAEQTEETTKKKKGFLPETKKRKNRKKPTILEGKETETPVEKTPEGASGEGKKKKNKKKNKKRKQQAGEETQDQPTPKKAKMQQQQKQKKKKKKKGADGE